MSVGTGGDDGGLAIVVMLVVVPVLCLALSPLVLLFGLGYTAMDDIKSGTAMLAWSREAITRALPLLLVIGATCMAVMRHHFSGQTARWCLMVMLALLLFLGPERAVVVGYICFLPLLLLGTAASTEERLEGRTRFVAVLGIFCIFVAGGALASCYDAFPSFASKYLLRGNLGTFLMPTKYHITYDRRWIELLPLLAANVFMIIMLVMADCSIKFHHKVLFGILSNLILMIGAIGGHAHYMSLDMAYSVVFGVLRVFNVSAVVHLLLHDKGPISLYDRLVLRVGMISRMAVEVGSACSLLGLL